MEKGREGEGREGEAATSATTVPAEGQNRVELQDTDKVVGAGPGRGLASFLVHDRGCLLFTSVSKNAETDDADQRILGPERFVSVGKRKGKSAK